MMKMTTSSLRMFLVLVCFSLTLFSVEGLYVNDEYLLPGQEELDEGSAICAGEGVVCPETDPPGEATYYSISNISQFCECSNGRSYLFNCPDGQIFNGTLNVCVDPIIEYSFILQNLLTGGEDYQPDSSELDEGTEVCRREGVTCPEEDGKYPVYLAISDRTQFCECSNGRPYLFNCPSPQIFDKDENVCGLED